METSRRTTVLRWVGLVTDPYRVRAALKGLSRFGRDYRAFSRSAKTPLRFRDAFPQLTDWTPTTPYDAHYLYQASWLARSLARSDPRIHVDVGSELSALSVMSAFVPLVFVDIRPSDLGLDGFLPISADGTQLPFPDSSVRSLSCLHVIEHVGLGRYGDALDPEGPRRLAAELERVLAPGGTLYVSTPVGRERVEFNAHRVFDPGAIPRLLASLELEEFEAVDDAFHHRVDVRPSDMSGSFYACGLYKFRRS